MTLSSSTAQMLRPAWPSPGLVLVAPGGVGACDGQRIAGLLGLRQLPCSADQQADANAALVRCSAEPSGWLLPLALDPGAELLQPGCWSEALGAWRQPVLLQVPALAASSGLARAYAALLNAAQVPLVGLVQLGQPWQPERRCSDGLAWLGWLPVDEPMAGSSEEQAAAALRLHLQARWQLSSARGAEPADPVA